MTNLNITEDGSKNTMEFAIDEVSHIEVQHTGHQNWSVSLVTEDGYQTLRDGGFFTADDACAFAEREAAKHRGTK